MSTLKFRVLLDSVNNEEVFRDILIDENDHFESFYRTIVESFGFSGDQLASFYMSNDSWDKGEEIGLLDMNYNPETEEESILQMADTKIKSKVEVQDQKIILVYDFLKMWIFLIELQDVLPQKLKKPEVMLSIGIAPNENDKSDEFLMELDENQTDFEEDDDYFNEFDDFDEEDLSEGFEQYEDF
jgi:hypothetical protein